MGVQGQLTTNYLLRLAEARHRLGRVVSHEVRGAANTAQLQLELLQQKLKKSGVDELDRLDDQFGKVRASLNETCRVLDEFVASLRSGDDGNGDQAGSLLVDRIEDLGRRSGVDFSHDGGLHEILSRPDWRRVYASSALCVLLVETIESLASDGVRGSELHVASRRDDEAATQEIVVIRATPATPACTGSDAAEPRREFEWPSLDGLPPGLVARSHGSEVHCWPSIVDATARGSTASG